MDAAHSSNRSAEAEPTLGFGGPPAATGRLAVIAKRVTTALSQSARGRLVAACELMPLEPEWERAGYIKEAGGLTFNQWIGGFSGVRHQDWRTYFAAAELLGKDWDAQAAVWVANKFGGDETSLLAVKGRHRQEWKKRARGDVGFPPLSLGVVRGFVRQMFGEAAVASRGGRACARCAELEALLRAAGVSVGG